MSHKRKLSRRELIKLLGATGAVAPSLLTSMEARAQAAAPVRVLLIPLQHGWGRDRDFEDITGTESNFVLPRVLSPFEAIKQQSVFVDGLRGTLWGNAHDVSYSDIFTAGCYWDEGASDQLGAHFPEPSGPSVDWIIGQAVNKPVLRCSARYTSWGKGHHPLCFDDNAREIAQYTSAQDAYDGIIDILNSVADPAFPQGVTAVREALFSFLDADTQRLMQRVEGVERLKVEGYLNAVRDLSNRVRGSGIAGTIAPADLPARPGSSDPFEVEIDNYFDLIRLAFTADTHRVAVLGLGEGVEDWNWTDSGGVPRGGNTFNHEGFHHDVAHYNAEVDPRLCFEGWCQWYAHKIVNFVQTLALVDDVDGRKLIDNTIIMLTGEVETGAHDTRSKLHILIGGGGGIQRGRWLKLPGVEPRDRQGVFIGGQLRDGTTVESGINYGSPFGRHHHADLLVTIANLAGASVSQIGLPVNNHQPLVLT